MPPKIAEAGAFLRRHEQLARIAGVSALIVLLSMWTSCSAWRTTKAARAQIGEVVAVRETGTRFARQFVPATTGETDEWSRTTSEAAEFGAAEALKVSTAQTVSRIAEVAGMSAVKASFTPLDSVGAAGPRNLGGISFQQATYGLRLEAVGSVPAVARVILRLPPATEITSLTLSGDAEALKATFQLAVYQPAGGPQN
jgi:hypothetical protein